MAGQQQQIIETIFNMKRRLLRKDDSSDSEETETPYNHRMQSLKRKAQYTRSGKPESASDPPPFKKRIEHAGYRRYILQRKPPRFDPDGDVVELVDEYEDEDDLSTVEENPYADIKLEELLAPLSSAADLPTHPSLSIPYTSTHLTNLTNEAGAISRKEQVALWRAKNLFTKLQGDLSYVPGGLADLNSSKQLSEEWTSVTNGLSMFPTNGDSQQLVRLAAHATDNELKEDTLSIQDTVMDDVAQDQASLTNDIDSIGTVGAAPETAPNGESVPATNGNTHNTIEDELQENGARPQSPAVDETSETASQQTAHRMTTRARAQAASEPSPPASLSSVVNHVHPLYLFPTDPLPDRDFGLPAVEAEETRLLLLAFVQKQEEIARAATDLYTGMLKGERMRQDVFKWSKAEAHVGEMSDGEDWYDREEWGLEQDLLKGRDEEEDETAVAGKKSTRQRRKPDKEDR